MNITLTGFMGTGKTSVGKKLAKHLGWRFVDVDQLIESSANMSVPEIFEKRGEAVFRRMERRCISRAVRGRHQVIATGGGAFVDAETRAHLRVTGPVVCLTASPQVIVSRVGRKLSRRPMLSGHANPLARIKTLLAQRASAYAKADVAIDTSHLSAEETVQRICRELGPYVCKGWHYLQHHLAELTPRYGGQYVVVVDDRIIASGKTQLAAYQKASARLTKTCQAGVYYIPLPEEAVTALSAQS
ncbi:MAG: shikimate kinase [Candidatus Omnitrophica bacterium]|nr:shikimate kinase [Candidatus Omnitrophota bacterium]